MHIENVKLVVDELTFQPQYKIELVLPIEQIMDTTIVKSEQECALDFYRTFSEKVNEILHYN